MKKSRLFFLFCLVSISLFGQNKGRNHTDGQKIPMKASSWKFEGQVDFIQHKGVEAMRINKDQPPVQLKDFTFESGTIEFDMEILDGPFVGLNFRIKDAQNAERFYLRPYRAGNPRGSCRRLS